jgi:hypothetical protein
MKNLIRITISTADALISDKIECKRNWKKLKEKDVIDKNKWR